MTEGLRYGAYLTGDSQSKPRRGQRRNQLIAISLALVCHLLLFIRIGMTSLPPPLQLADNQGVTLGLIRSVAIAKTPDHRPRAVAKTAPQPVQESPKPPAHAPPSPEPDLMSPLQASVDPTTEPAELETPPVAKEIAASELAAPADSGLNCDPTGLLLVALQNSVLVKNELARIPRQRRSVANAIMLWDGQWSDIHGLVAGAQPSAIRQTITEVIHAMPPNCQIQPVEGPRLLPIPDAGGETVIALGSGAWKWSDLLQDADIKP